MALRNWLSGLGVAKRADKILRSWFPDRQIYVRSNGVVRYLSLSRHIQMSIVGAALVLSIWVGITSTSLIFGNDVVLEKERKIAELRGDREDLSDELRLLRAELLDVAARVEDRQERIESVIGLTPGFDLQSREASTVLRTEPTDPAHRHDSGVSHQHSLLERFTALETRQIELLQTYRDGLIVELEALETGILHTGLNAEKLLLALDHEEAPAGGPLQLLEPAVSGHPEDMLDIQIASVMNDLQRYRNLKFALASVPLAKPVDEYYISSSFGRRMDPFRKQWAMHAGLDLAWHWKTPIKATSDGVVTLAGRNGPYGRMVEIDHGNGFKTRYGHLAKILVKAGDKIRLGDELGLMGNSGRSTGTHLHYEVRFKDVPLNPSKFLKAGEHFNNG